MGERKRVDVAAVKAAGKAFSDRVGVGPGEPASVFMMAAGYRDLVDEAVVGGLLIDLGKKLLDDVVGDAVTEMQKAHIVANMIGTFLVGFESARLTDEQLRDSVSGLRRDIEQQFMALHDAHTVAASTITPASEPDYIIREVTLGAVGEKVHETLVSDRPPELARAIGVQVEVKHGEGCSWWAPAGKDPENPEECVCERVDLHFYVTVRDKPTDIPGGINVFELGGI